MNSRKDSWSCPLNKAMSRHSTQLDGSVQKYKRYGEIITLIKVENVMLLVYRKGKFCQSI